jgi:hypothetical protein
MQQRMRALATKKLRPSGAKRATTDFVGQRQLQSTIAAMTFGDPRRTATPTLVAKSFERNARELSDLGRGRTERR